MRQFCVTTAMGKRLIGKAMAEHPEVEAVLEKGTLVIIAGTTNGYVAEEILKSIGQAEGFVRVGFHRGIVVAPGAKAPRADFPGDVVIVDGKWHRGKTIYDVADDLKKGDLVLKGANAFDSRGQPAVLVENTQGGTALAATRAVVGRRARMIVPVGLEKRVFEDVNVLAQLCCEPEAHGPCLFPLLGEMFTELDAIELLTGAVPFLIAAGGVCGAEGSYWIGVDGDEDEVQAAVDLVKSIADEPAWES